MYHLNFNLLWCNDVLILQIEQRLCSEDIIEGASTLLKMTPSCLTLNILLLTTSRQEFWFVLMVLKQSTALCCSYFRGFNVALHCWLAKLGLQYQEKQLTVVTNLYKQIHRGPSLMSRSIWRLSKSPIYSWVSAVKKRFHTSIFSIRSAMSGPGSIYLEEADEWTPEAYILFLTVITDEDYEV